MHKNIIKKTLGYGILNKFDEEEGENKIVEINFK